MRSILDPAFHYVPSANTDLRKTFARVRKAQAAAAQAANVPPPEPPSNVQPITALRKPRRD